MKFALAAVLAVGVMSAQADEDPIAAAAAAAIQQVTQVSQSAEGMPDATVKQVAAAEAAKNPPPTEKEMKQDAGVQTVIQMQDKGKFPEKNPRKMSAQDQVLATLKKNDIKVGNKGGRIVVVDSVDMPMSDPANDKKFFIKRDMMAKLLVLKMKGQVAAGVGQVVNAEERAEIFGGTESNTSIKVDSKFGAVAKWPLFGVTVIAQAESWDGEKYHMAAASVWSKVLHKAAKATLLGENIPGNAGKLSVEKWLEERDVSVMCGPRQLVDPDGNRVFLGIAAREVGVSSAKDMINREAAKASAQSYLTFSLFADVEQQLAHSAAAGIYEGTDEKKSEEASELINLKLSQKVENRVIAGANEILGQEYEHKLSGKKIYVSVYAMDIKSATNARVMAEELIATRVQTELANKRALGRLQGYQDQVDAAKANTEEFEKGRAEGNAAIQKKLAPPKGRVINEAATPIRRNVKSQKGTYSGESSISNDF